MRIVPTVIAAILGAVAAWATVLAIWLCFEYPYIIAVVMITGVGALSGVLSMIRFTEIKEKRQHERKRQQHERAGIL